MLTNVSRQQSTKHVPVVNGSVRTVVACADVGDCDVMRCALASGLSLFLSSSIQKTWDLGPAVSFAGTCVFVHAVSGSMDDTVFSITINTTRTMDVCMHAFYVSGYHSLFDLTHRHCLNKP